MGQAHYSNSVMVVSAVAAAAVEVAELCGEVPEEDALVERPPYALPQDLAATTPQVRDGPLASVVVEGPVGGYFLPIFHEAFDKPCDVMGRLPRLLTPERVEVVLATQEGGDAGEEPVLPLAGQVSYEAVLGNLIRPW